MHRRGQKLQKVDVVLPPGLVQSLLHGASFRVGVFGDRNTGKSSLINRIAGNAWAPELRGVAACQVQWRSSTQQQHVSGDAPATLDVQEIKDTLNLLESSHTGAEPDGEVQRRRSNLVAFRESLLACDAIIGVYDPTRRTSFDYIKAAIKLMLEGLPAGPQQNQHTPAPTTEVAFVEAEAALPPVLLVSNFKDEESSKQHSVSRVLFAEAQDYVLTLRRSSHGPARDVYVTEASCVNCYGLVRTAEFLDIPFLRAQVRCFMLFNTLLTLWFLNQGWSGQTNKNIFTVSAVVCSSMVRQNYCLNDWVKLQWQRVKYRVIFKITAQIQNPTIPIGLRG